MLLHERGMHGFPGEWSEGDVPFVHNQSGPREASRGEAQRKAFSVACPIHCPVHICHPSICTCPECLLLQGIYCLYVLFPIITHFCIFLIAYCALLQENECTLTKLPKFSWKPELYFDIHVFGYYCCFVMIQLIIQMLPIGRKVKGPHTADGRHEYRLNGKHHACVNRIYLHWQRFIIFFHKKKI